MMMTAASELGAVFVRERSIICTPNMSSLLNVYAYELSIFCGLSENLENCRVLRKADFLQH
jgi:hypothetical protein